MPGLQYPERRPGESMEDYAERVDMPVESVRRMLGGVEHFHEPLSIDDLRRRHPRESEARLASRLRENQMERFRSSHVRNVLKHYRSGHGADFRSNREILADWRVRGVTIPRFDVLDTDGLKSSIPFNKWTEAERRFLTDVLGETDDEIRDRYR